MSTSDALPAFSEQQLREFEVANENLLQPDAEADDALSIFLRSTAYAEYLVCRRCFCD